MQARVSGAAPVVQEIGFFGAPILLAMKPSWRRFGRLALICFGFAIGSGVIACDPDTIYEKIFGIIGAVFFSGIGLLFLYVLFVAKPELKLDREGFSYATLRRTHAYGWREITSPFAIIVISRRKLVVFSSNRPPTKQSRLNQAMFGHDALLPDTYAMPADELAGLMTNMWERAAGQ